MANPQPVPFVQTSAELFDAAARFRFKGQSRACFDCIMRHTYGGLRDDGTQGKVNRKSCRLSCQQIAEYTGQSPTAVKAQMAWLVAGRIIDADGFERGRGHKAKWSIQKDYELWTSGHPLHHHGGGLEALHKRSPRVSFSGEDKRSPRVTVKGQAVCPEKVRPCDLLKSPRVSFYEGQVAENTGDNPSTILTYNTYLHTSGEKPKTPSSLKELSRAETDRLLPLARAFEKTLGKRIYAWINSALAGTANKSGRRYWPETIARVLEGVGPVEKMRDPYAVLTSCLNSTQELVEHEEHKRLERESPGPIDVSGIAKRIP